MGLLRLKLIFTDFQTIDQLAVFVELDRMVFPLGDRDNQRASETGRVAFLARRLKPQTYNSFLFGHGGDPVGTKCLAPPDGGQDQLGIKGIGGEAG